VSKQPDNLDEGEVGAELNRVEGRPAIGHGEDSTCFEFEVVLPCLGRCFEFKASATPMKEAPR
jgi:hypothetical protein